MGPIRRWQGGWRYGVVATLLILAIVTPTPTAWWPGLLATAGAILLASVPSRRR
jgi:hypothetical protein